MGGAGAAHAGKSKLDRQNADARLILEINGIICFGLAYISKYESV
jgi:hypothetical protein